MNCAADVRPKLNFVVKETHFSCHSKYFSEALNPNTLLWIWQRTLDYLLTELSPSWEAANCGATQEIPSIFKEAEGSSPCSQELSTGHYPILITTAWRVLRLRMEEAAFRYGGVAANILNKQSRTADKSWSSSLGVGRGANNSSP
jgi:hypothetical protein